MVINRVASILLFLVLSFSQIAFGDCSKFVVKFLNVPSATAEGEKPIIKTGATVELTQEGKKSIKALFLGEMVSVSGNTNVLGFYENGQIHYIAKERAVITQDVKLRTYVKTTGQVGPTCAGYSMFSCLRQLSFRGQVGNGKILEKLADEESRTTLLMEMVSRYHVEKEHDVEVIFAPYGYNTYPIPSDHLLKSEVEKYLRAGHPILVSFDVPESMGSLSYKITGYEKEIEEAQSFSQSLWFPKEDSREVSAGRHMVLFLAVFEIEGKKFALVSDPNRMMPRFWNLDRLDHVESAEIKAFVIHQKK